MCEYSMYSSTAVLISIEMQPFSENTENSFCSRCSKYLKKPIFTCPNNHLACKDCRKVFCKKCKDVFEELKSGVGATAITNPEMESLHPYEPNDGFVEFGEPFTLLRRGLCCHHFKRNGKNFKFKWIISPHEGIIQINLSPKEICQENWFVLEFFHPLDLSKTIKKEWILSHVLKIRFNELEGLYFDDTIICKILVFAIPIGNCVKTIEDVLRDGFSKLFNLNK